MHNANLARFITTSLLLLIAPTVFAVEHEVWSDVSEAQVPASGDRWIIPSSYRTIALDRAALTAILQAAPLEGSANAQSVDVILELPLPEGEHGRFRIMESPIMEPELAAKYPEIRTYLGQGVDDTSATLRFDLTPTGFHAAIHSVQGRIYIDPYSRGDVTHHISYYTNDYPRSTAETWRCLVSEEQRSETPDGSQRAPERPNGDVLKTYRTVVAATAEYTKFHSADLGSPTVAEGMAAIVTAMNRVNAVYQRDLAVRHVLVANNDEVVYIDPTRDPYDNSNPRAMLKENQANLSKVIGSPNYDIGHVFSTSGGGIARLLSACGPHKAGGVSGSPRPTGDSFWVDIVAHELGHQWGGHHTFNGNARFCFSNRNPSTAYEPGSGSTIMSYAGICGNQNIQTNSDDYFHSISYQEIIDFIATLDDSTCGASSNTGNTPPTPDAGDSYAIPIRTPFELCGSAVDPDGDTLSYNWEQFNLGPAGHPGQPVDDAPIFRSFPPSESSCRMFPQLSDLRDNTQTIGELLPSYARTLTFRMLVRDNRAGGGGADYDEVNIEVIGTNDPFRVTSPNTATQWFKGDTETVTWDVAGTDQSPISCTRVDILLSTDSAETFDTVLAAGTANDGSENITVPDLESSQARVQVRCSDNIFFDVSNTDFNLVGDLIFRDGFESGDLSAWKELVGTDNAAPQVTILSPVDGASFPQGAEIPFVGLATDPEDGDLTPDLRWLSSLGQEIGTGGCFIVDDLQVGQHEIVATATDTGNLRGLESITITVYSSQDQGQSPDSIGFDRLENVGNDASRRKIVSTQVSGESSGCPDMDVDLSAPKPILEPDPMGLKVIVSEKCGEEPLEGVQVTPSPLPPGLTFLCQTGCPEVPANSSTGCNFGTVPAGGDQSYFVIVAVEEDPPDISWRVRAEVSNADPAEAVIHLDSYLIFSDGFELGNTFGWAVTVP